MGRNEILHISGNMKGFAPESGKICDDFLVDIRQGFVPGAFKNVAVEHFVEPCQLGDVLILGSQDGVLMDIPKLTDLVVAAALNRKLHSKRFDGNTNIIQIPKLKFVIVEPIHNVFLFGFVLLLHECTTAGPDLHKAFGLQQTDGFPDGTAANTEIRAQFFLCRQFVTDLNFITHNIFTQRFFHLLNSRNPRTDLKGLQAEEKMLREKAEMLLDYVGLYNTRDELVKNLPYGNRKVLEVARALMMDPKLLLLDEPAAGLNPSERAEFIQLLHRIHEQGTTLFFIEHNMDVVMSISKMITVVNFGAKIAEGSPTEIQNNPEVIKVYLGERYQVKK